MLRNLWVMHALKDLTPRSSDKLLPDTGSIGNGAKWTPKNQKFHFLFGKSHRFSLAKSLLQLYSS